MRVLLCCAVALGLLTACFGPARAASDWPRHEVWLGAGGAVSSEHSVFNVPDDIESEPEVAFSMGYLYNLNTHAAIGFQFYGAAETTPAVSLLDATGTTRQATFNMTNVNVGLRGRYMFSGRALKPYVLGGINWVSGSADSRTLGEFVVDVATIGELRFSGFSACVGAGLGITLRQRVLLSVEAVGSFGSAEWSRKPFLNSTSADFNPSIASGTLNLSYLWGWGP